jgi:hypothetical protein
LPERFNNEATINKSFTPKKVVWGYETDLTGEGGFGLNPTLYNEYADVINYITLRGSTEAEFVSSNTVKLSNVSVPDIPPFLLETFDETERFRVYINGVFIPAAKYSYNYNYSLKELVFIFNTTPPVSPTSLGYIIETTDEIVVTGKFLEL